MKMYCVHCGNQLKAEAKFCSKCGNPTGKNPESEPSHSNAKKDNSTLLAVLIGAGILLVIYFVFNYSSTPQDQYQPGISAQSIATTTDKPEIRSNVPSDQQPSSKRDLSSIIAEWHPRVALVVCKISSWNTGQDLGYVGGSGFLFDVGGTPTVITNKHVLVDLRNPQTTPDFHKTDSCTVKFPNSPNIYPVSLSDVTLGYQNGVDVDWGAIPFRNPDSYLQSLINSNLKVCSQPPSLGDGVLILGYPGIGSPTDITATNGIISGFEGDYYISDAKIEHGDSGGAAISVNDDCYLGLPSAAVVGQIESLARILKWQSVLRAPGQN